MKNKLVIALLILILSNSYATDYFVTTPAEISAKMQIAQPGDTLTMANGVWSDARIIFKGNGAEGDSILLRAETPGYVILDGIATLRIAGSYLKVDGLRFIGGYSNSGAVVEFRYSGIESQHCRMTNCSIVDYNPSNKDRDYKWVSLYGAYNRVDHCFFEGKTHSGTTLVVWLSGQPNYHRIDQNYFGERPPLGYNGGETIRVGTSDWSMYDSFTIVESNYFEHCNGEIEIISNKSCENIYRHNTFYECEGALTLRHGNRNTVEGNFFIGNQKDLTGGVRVIGEDQKVINNYFYGLYGSSFKSALPILNGVPNSPLNRYFQVKRALIAFNTFVDCRYTMILGAGSDNERTLPPLDCVIANNVVQTNHKIITKEDEPINLVWEGNMMQGSSLGITQPPGIVLANPNLKLSVDNLYRPDSTSPVFGAAQGTYDFVTKDMDGQVRGQSKDVGADQISNEPIVYRPLTANDVGPGWKLSVVPYVLSVKKTGSGRVVLDPPGQIYQSGSIVQAVAIPDSGWRFKSWKGDVESNSDSIQVVMDDHKTIEAVFESAQFTVSAFVFSGGGTIAFNPPGGSYAENSTITVTAVPDSGWRFVNWGGSLSGSTNPESLLMNENKTIFATFENTTSVDELSEIPRRNQLYQNYPNPFNSTTLLSYELQVSDEVELQILNSNGQIVKTIIKGFQQAGKHEVAWNASEFSSGVYFVKLRIGQFVDLKKMIYLR